VDKISKPFIKESRKGFIVFDFEQERWQRIGKFYEGILLGFLFILVFGGLFIFGSITIFFISLGASMLGVIITPKTTFIPKKYFLKTVKVKRRTIEFTYDDKDIHKFTFPKDEVHLIVHSSNEMLEIEYASHIMNFKNSTDVTTFLDNVVLTSRLEFDKSVEAGIKREVLHYKVIPTKSKHRQR
jgi:hypothetical protein